jgi:hypothetical protein
MRSISQPQCVARACVCLARRRVCRVREHPDSRHGVPTPIASAARCLPSLLLSDSECHLVCKSQLRILGSSLANQTAREHPSTSAYQLPSIVRGSVCLSQVAQAVLPSDGSRVGACGRSGYPEPNYAFAVCTLRCDAATVLVPTQQ